MALEVCLKMLSHFILGCLESYTGKNGVQNQVAKL
jgi:hypothetical protein